MSGTFQCVYLDDMPRSISALSLMAMSSLITPDIASLAATTTDTKTHTPSPLRAPQAVLLDFGGVIFETSKYPDGRDRLAELYARLLSQIAVDYPVARLRESIDAGLTALKSWKNAWSRKLAPRELTHREVITDFMVSDLPTGPREFLASHAKELVKQQNLLISGHHMRPGIPEFVAECQRRDIPLGIVSNAHSGASHRQILADHGLGQSFAVQVYSDEIGIRKPHPDMLSVAADALDVELSACWYVGDTQDRDVVAGRRAGVGAVILTRCHHTDTPPFAVRDRADVILDTPSGLVDLLAQATDEPTNNSVVPPKKPAGETPRLSLLMDHGGVISHSQQDPEAQAEFLSELTALIRPVAGDDDPHELASSILKDALAAHRQGKRERQQRGDHAEVTPAVFWGIYGAKHQKPAIAALLRSEASDLMERWGRAKSCRTLRTGIRDLLAWCAQHGHRVVVVTNTVSGSAVRYQLQKHGIAEFITAVVASDEFGVRKPDPAIVQAALDIADADPRHTFFLGDKPDTDGLGAAACGISHRILVRGGSTEEPALQTALDDQVATHILDEPSHLLPLMQQVAL